MNMLPLLLPAPHVAGHLALVDDRLLVSQLLGRQPPPVRVEGLAAPGREGRHPVRLGITLVLEERVEVAVDHFPQNTVHPEDTIGVEGGAGRVVLQRPGVQVATRPSRA